MVNGQLSDQLDHFALGQTAQTVGLADKFNGGKMVTVAARDQLVTVGRYCAPPSANVDGGGGYAAQGGKG